MSMKHRNERSDLTAEEQAVVGKPGDLVSEDAIPARPRSRSVMVSLRLDRRDFDELSRLAEQDGRTFSETARKALRAYIGEPRADTPYPLHHPDSPRTARRVSESAELAWDDEDLLAALERYEADCRRAAMRENARRSYVDYARRFLAWRTGDYQPRGTRRSDRPVARTAVSTLDLRQQAEQYARQVEAAGREQPTVDTYFRHAMFFIRWLEGEFQPGSRLRALR